MTFSSGKPGPQMLTNGQEIDEHVISDWFVILIALVSGAVTAWWLKKKEFK